MKSIKIKSGMPIIVAYGYLSLKREEKEKNFDLFAFIYLKVTLLLSKISSIKF